MIIFSADAQAKGIEISLIIEPHYTELGVDYVKGDPARIMQIVSNLITNSIKFTADVKTKKLIEIHLDASLEEPTSYGDVIFTKEDIDGESISINKTENSCSYGDSVYLIITVKDTGIGMSRVFQNTMFSRFKQAPKTESKYGGSGTCGFLVSL